MRSNSCPQHSDLYNSDTKAVLPRGKKKKMDSKGNSSKKRRNNNEYICMNEPKATLNYCPLEAEADAFAKFKMKSHIPQDPFLAITV